MVPLSVIDIWAYKYGDEHHRLYNVQGKHQATLQSRYAESKYHFSFRSHICVHHDLFDHCLKNKSEIMSAEITTTASGSDAYSNATEHGSGTIGGPGFGNKTATDEDIDTSSTRLGTASDTRTYSGGTSLGSGTTAGPG